MKTKKLNVECECLGKVQTVAELKTHLTAEEAAEYIAEQEAKHGEQRTNFHD